MDKATNSILHQSKQCFFSFHSSGSVFPSLNSLQFGKPCSTLSFHSSEASSKPQSYSSYLWQQHQEQCLQATRVSTAPVNYATSPSEFYFQSEISRLKALRSKLAVSKDLRAKQSVIDSDSRVKRFFSKYNKCGFARVLASVTLDSRELYLIKCLVAAGQEHIIHGGGFAEAEEENSMRSSMKAALYALAEMIEGLNLSNAGGEASGNRNGVVVGDDKDVAGLREFLKILDEMEQFYDCIGGIIGYQILALELLAQSKFEKHTTCMSNHVNESMQCQLLEIYPPGVLDLSENKEYASQAALWGIEGLPDLGEIYPLGGSADRLGLVDPVTGECLPAAMLPFCGRTLLEGLIRDLQAREFLYFKIYRKQCITPVAIMTSSAKKNHERISSLCERLGWFGRGQSSFQLFEQPLVPAVNAEEGQWLVAKPFSPVCKPGGHGVIWKLAYDKGIFQWFFDHGRRGATVRQVSNVVAATDLTLMALAGIGLRHGKKLGFASCKRNAGATEGINVLIEKKNPDGKWACGISCIEYTEFDKFGIADGRSNSLQNEYPANTNILYVDLPSAERVVSSSSEKSLPNMVLNTGKPVVYVDQFGKHHSVLGGRLECTMQNIADNFFNTFSSRCYQNVEDKLDTYIVYDERRRVTSSAKKKRRQGQISLHQSFIIKETITDTSSCLKLTDVQLKAAACTPDGALLDVLRNSYDLLSQCNIRLPEIEGNDEYVDSGPPYLIFLHPALGPIWEVTKQKFSGGSISMGSELQLEIAEFSWRDVKVDGSLIVVAKNAMGSTSTNEDGEPILHYGHRCGRCRLNNVKVLNEGIDWRYGDNVYWKHEVQRFETCRIILHGNAEFEASNVTLQGNHVFEVPAGYKLRITSGNSGISSNLEPIKPELMETGSWYWNYIVNGTHILLDMVEL